MHVLRLPTGTTEYLRARVRVDRDKTSPTTFTASLALISRTATPAAPDWQVAEWAAGGPPYYAQRLFTGVTGKYRLWVKVVTPTETVVRPAGLVEFYATPE